MELHELGSFGAPMLKRGWRLSGAGECASECPLARARWHALRASSAGCASARKRMSTHAHVRACVREGP
eukprot:6193903-Pleurochrysis_carterae.AAC.1